MTDEPNEIEIDSLSKSMIRRFELCGSGKIIISQNRKLTERFIARHFYHLGRQKPMGWEDAAKVEGWHSKEEWDMESLKVSNDYNEKDAKIADLNAEVGKCWKREDEKQKKIADLEAQLKSKGSTIIAGDYETEKLIARIADLERQVQTKIGAYECQTCKRRFFSGWKIKCDLCHESEIAKLERQARKDKDLWDNAIERINDLERQLAECKETHLRVPSPELDLLISANMPDAQKPATAEPTDDEAEKGSKEAVKAWMKHEYLTDKPHIGMLEYVYLRGYIDCKLAAQPQSTEHLICPTCERRVCEDADHASAAADLHQPSAGCGKQPFPHDAEMITKTEMERLAIVDANTDCPAQFTSGAGRNICRMMKEKQQPFDEKGWQEFSQSNQFLKRIREEEYIRGMIDGQKEQTCQSSEETSPLFSSDDEAYGKWLKETAAAFRTEAKDGGVARYYAIAYEDCLKKYLATHQPRPSLQKDIADNGKFLDGMIKTGERMKPRPAPACEKCKDTGFLHVGGISYPCEHVKDRSATWTENEVK